MEASDDRMEDIELPAATLDSVADGEQAATAAANADAYAETGEQPAPPDADAEMAAGDHPDIEGITVTTRPPEAATGVTAYFLFANVHRERVKEALQQGLSLIHI